MKKLFYDFDFEKSTVTITGSLLSAGRRLYAHPTGRATFLPWLTSWYSCWSDISPMERGHQSEQDKPIKTQQLRFCHSRYRGAEHAKTPKKWSCVLWVESVTVWQYCGDYNHKSEPTIKCGMSATYSKVLPTTPEHNTCSFHLMLRNAIIS